MVDAVTSYGLCIHLYLYVPMSSYNIPLVADIHFVEITSIFSLVEITKLSMLLDNSIFAHFI
jgi:4-hydroxy-3-methylbut-2-en-1-yl diphosphate synthase IspG/GcpE